MDFKKLGLEIGGISFIITVLVAVTISDLIDNALYNKARFNFKIDNITQLKCKGGEVSFDIKATVKNTEIVEGIVFISEMGSVVRKQVYTKSFADKPMKDFEVIHRFKEELSDIPNLSGKEVAVSLIVLPKGVASTDLDTRYKQLLFAVRCEENVKG